MLIYLGISSAMFKMGLSPAEAGTGSRMVGRRKREAELVTITLHSISFHSLHARCLLIYKYISKD